MRFFMRISIVKHLIACLSLVIIFTACGSQSPLDRLQKELDQFPEYSILLQDMRQDGSVFPKYLHRYKLVYATPDPNKPDSLVFLSNMTNWMEVSEQYYKDNQNYLGMVLASKSRDGKTSNDKFPPGYQYVGNPQYGQWRQNSDGTSFWEFYGKYALMSQVFGLLGGGPIYRNDWNTYRDYRASNRPYYGKNNRYGTFGTATKKTNPNFFQRKQVRQQTQRSNFLNKFKSRVNRGTQSTYRSRSFGGFGK